MKNTSLFLWIIFLLMYSHILAQSELESLFDANIVKVNAGLLQGVNDPETGLRYFWGVPYAQPPIGDLRWREPQSVKPWKGIRQAVDFGPRAMQEDLFADMQFRAQKTSEDALYLNIWTPAEKTVEELPVLVYFYGGGFVGGDGSEWRYDGASLAQKGIIVITVNYRLGVFGFFAHPELTKTSPHHSSGNYGLLDQRAALQWVHENIAAFGGDPKRITIGGESAGSISVFAQMASPLSRHLIAGVIGESGAMIPPTFPPISLEEAEKRGQAFAQEMDVNSLQELKNIPADKLLAKASTKNMNYFAPTVDGYFFPQPPLEIFKAGKQAAVPALIGWNSAESAYTGFMQGKEPTPENYKERLKKHFGKYAKAALSLFPGKNQKQVIRSATALASNDFIAYSSWKWTELQRKTGRNKVFRYLFEKSRPKPAIKTDWNTNTISPAPLGGAGHSWEIEYAFGNLKTNKFFDWTPEDYRVSAIMQTYFSNFIKTGNPNKASLPHWEPNTKQSDPVQVMHINAATQLKPEEDRSQFEFLDQFYAKKIK